jgi:hypothetical protein
MECLLCLWELKVIPQQADWASSSPPSMGLFCGPSTVDGEQLIRRHHHTSNIYCQDDKSRTIQFNTWPLGHTEIRDLYPVQCWRGTGFNVSLRFIVQMYLEADLTPLSVQLEAGCLCLQTPHTHPYTAELYKLWRQSNHWLRSAPHFHSRLLTVWTIALHTTVIEAGDIFSELHTFTFSDISDEEGETIVNSSFTVYG